VRLLTLSSSSTRDVERCITAVPRVLLILNCLALLLGARITLAAEPEQVVGRAMVVLKQHCISCHNHEKKKGGLVLTSREMAMHGGESGPVIVPGKSGESALAAAVLPEADPHMPPKGQLTPDEISAIKAWIDSGAAWDEKKLLEVKTAVTRPVQLRALPARYQPVLAMALSPDQKRLAVGRGDRVLVYDVAEKGRPMMLDLAMVTGDVVQSLAWGKDGKWLAAGGYRRVRLWDGGSGELKRDLSGIEGRVTAMAFTPDGQTLVAADGEVASPGMIRTWRVDNGEAQGAWKAHDDNILSLDLSTDGKLLVTGGADRLVRLWELSDRKELGKFEGHAAAVTAVALSVDGKRLASASADKEIKIWDVAGKQLKASLTSNPAGVTHLAWVDAKTVLSACEDGVARFTTEEEKTRATRTFSGAPDVLYCAAITGDGKTVLAGCHDGAVYVWSAAGAKLEAKLPSTRPAKAPTTMPTTMPTPGPTTAAATRPVSPKG
jgi:WD40 repeat protein